MSNLKKLYAKDIEKLGIHPQFLNDLENKISGLTNIVKISSGTGHNLAIDAMRCTVFMGNKYLWRMWN